MTSRSLSRSVLLLVPLTAAGLLATAPARAGSADLETADSSGWWGIVSSPLDGDTHLLSGDYNGDGIDELARVYGASGHTHIGVHIDQIGVAGHGQWLSLGGVHGVPVPHYLSGDFNGDGYDDVMKAFSDAGGTTMDLFVSSGSSFSYSRAITSTGGHWGGQRFVAGDFNGDGCDDVVKIWSYTGGTIADVYFSDEGSFTGFTSQTVHSTRLYGSADQFLAGDLDGDGVDELVWASESSGSLAVDVVDLTELTGGTVTFTNWTSGLGDFAVGATLEVDDFDGDGVDDLVHSALAEEQLTAEVLLSSGSGFSRHALVSAATRASRITAADTDGDGKAELVGAWAVSIQTGQDVVLERFGFDAQFDGAMEPARWASGLGGFWDGQEYLAGDFQGDGYPDIARVFNEPDTTSIDVHLSGAAPGLTYSRWISNMGFHEMTLRHHLVGDFNGDGKDDIVKAFYDADALSVFQYTSTGSSFTFSQPIYRQGYFGWGGRVTAGDMNGDGIDDLVKIMPLWNGSIYTLDVYVYLGSSTGFSAPQHWAYATGQYTPYDHYITGDLNGDDRDDLVQIRPSTFVAGEFLAHTGATWFSQPFPLAQAHVLVSSGANSFHPSAQWLGHTGPLMESSQFVTADVDGDGLDDLVSVHGDNAGNVGMWLNRSVGVALLSHGFIDHSEVPYTGQLKAVAADFDGDGDDEIATMYGDALGTTSFDVYGGQPTGPDPARIHIPGSTASYTPAQLAANLSTGSGLTLDSYDTLEAGHCTIVYPEGDAATPARNFGMLTCLIDEGDGDYQLKTEKVYGGCDVDPSSGAANCSIGKVDRTIHLDLGPAGDVPLTIRGPAATGCASVTDLALCGGIRSRYYTKSFSITSDNISLNAGLYVGPGAGASASFNNGAFSGTADLSAVHSDLTIRLDVDGEDAASEVTAVGAAGVVYLDDGTEVIGSTVDEVLDTADVAGAASWSVAAAAGLANEILGGTQAFFYGGWDALEGYLDDAGGAVCSILGC